MLYISIEQSWTRAKQIKSSQPRVAKMEASDPSVSIDLLIRALLATGATRNALAKVFGSRGGKSDG